MQNTANICKEKNKWKSYISDAFSAFTPPEKLTVSEWADKYRILDEKSSASSGPWKTERTPYLRKIMDMFCEEEIEELNFCAGSQLGKTEAEYNMLCYAVDQDPGPVLVVYPTDSLAKFASENRLQPMFRISPAIKDKFNERTSDLYELQFTNNYIALVGANSPSDLASRPVRYIFFDEVDKYPKWSGKEANPLSLAEERQKTFSYNKKTIKVSTPTLNTGSIWKSYTKSDLRLGYYVSCPHCGYEQKFTMRTEKGKKYGGIKWPEDLKDPQLIRYATWYECCNCGQKIDDRHKMEMLRQGDWKPDNTPIGRVKSVGFHLNSIYSPWLTFGDVAAKFISVKDNPEELMNFINSWLAEPWQPKAKRSTADSILEKRINYLRGKVHQSSQILVAGVDVQLDHFWWGVRAWGADLTSWLVDYGRVETWTNIEKVLRQAYPMDETGESVYINKACIDSGYNTDEVYKFCAYNQDICVPTKGSSKPLRSRYTQSRIDKDIALGLILYIHDPNQFKDFIAGRLSRKINTPGAWMLPSDIDRLYADQIVAEQKVDGKWEKISSHAQNHMLDVEVNIALAAELCGVRYLLPVPDMVAQTPVERSEGKPWVGNTNNWIKR